jgi:ABC-type transporter Mla subunit MlaD
MRIDETRITEHVSPSLLRIELRRALKPLVVLALGFAVAAAAGDYILNNINGGIGSTHTMQFQIADATGVVPGRAEVRFYGISAGEITAAKLEHGHAVLTVTVANKFGRVYRNAQAEVRPNTALQDMYLDIVDRGTPDAGVAGPGYVVPEGQTQSPTNLAEVLDTFQPDVRGQLYNVIDQLGNGLADHGADLRETFVLLAPFLQVAGKVSRQLAAQSTLTRQLVHYTAALSSLLASRSTQLREIVTSGGLTLRSLATDGGTPLRETISELPSTLSALQTFLSQTDGLLPPLNRAAGALEPVADELPTSLANLRQLGVSADPALRKLRTPVTRLVPLADQLEPFATDLAGSLQRIAPQVSDVNELTKDLSECTTQINEFFNWDASMAKFHVGIGQQVRGNANFGFYSVPGVQQSTYGYGSQCDGGAPLGDVPTPKYDGPAVAP